MLKLSRNNKNIKMLGVPSNTLPLVIYIRIFCYGVFLHLQHVIQNNCRWVWWCFLMVWSTFWRSRKNLTNVPKLSCGFNLEQFYIDFTFRGFCINFPAPANYSFRIHKTDRIHQTCALQFPKNFFCMMLLSRFFLASKITPKNNCNNIAMSHAMSRKLSYVAFTGRCDRGIA